VVALMIVGIAMVRDEIDVIERTVEHMAYQCDSVVIADNGSEDGTRELLGTLPCVVVPERTASPSASCSRSSPPT
jgi:hypothetical protein